MDMQTETVIEHAKVSGAAAANVPFEGFRQPRTLTTLSWSDGRLGRGFVTISSDQCSEKLREKMNKDCAWENSLFYLPLSKLSEDSEELVSSHDLAKKVENEHFYVESLIAKSIVVESCPT